MLKRFIFTITFCLLFVTSAFAAHGTWQQEGTNWKYVENDQAIIGDHKLIDNKWYYFDDNGYMVTGPQEIDDKFYIFNDDGTAAADLNFSYDGKNYSVTSKGEVKNITEEAFYGYLDSLSNNKILGVEETKLVSGNDMNAKVFEKIFRALVSNLPISKKSLSEVMLTYGFNSQLVDKYVLELEQDDSKMLSEKCGVYFYTLYNIDRDEIKKILTSEGFDSIEVNYGVERTLNFSGATKGTGEYKLLDSEKQYHQDMINKAKEVVVSLNDSAVNNCLIELEKDKAAIKADNERKAVENKLTQESIAAKNAADEEARQLAINNQKNKIVSSDIKTEYFSITNFDDVSEKEREYRIEASIYFPVFEGEKADALNNAVNTQLFEVIKNHLNNYHFDYILQYKKYKSYETEISTQNDSEMVIVFKGKSGNPTIDVKIDLNTFTIS